jgi:hypothetical protein
MPKQKQFQLSGAKKRQIAKQKAASEQSAITSAPRLDRDLVHSLATVDESSRNIDNISDNYADKDDEVSASTTSTSRCIRHKICNKIQSFSNEIRCLRELIFVSRLRQNSPV